MNSSGIRKYSQLKDRQPLTYVKRKVIGKSSSAHKSPHLTVNLKQDLIYSARRTNPKPYQEVNNKEENNKAEAINSFNEKKRIESLRKSLHQKDQIILAKNIRIKQLEIETIALKAQLERCKLRNRQMSLELEAKRKNTTEMARALLYNYLNEQRNEEEEHSHLPNPDTMSYEELLELENKMGYVSKGLSLELINAIPLVEYKMDQDSDSKCLICQYEFIEAESLRKVKCNHLFHRECLDQWLRDEKICPNCKREI